MRYGSTDEAVYLSATIKSTPDGAYVLHQQKFVEDLLKCWNMDACRPSATPGADSLLKGDGAHPLMERPTHTSDQEEVNVQDVRQAQKLAGSLIWLATRTRPNISYAQSAVSSLAARDPSRAMMLGKRALRYLAGTSDVGCWARERFATSRAPVMWAWSLGLRGPTSRLTAMPALRHIAASQHDRQCGDVLRLCAGMAKR